MQEVLLFTEPNKREVWENTFNSNDFHVYSFHPLKDLINSETAINLIEDDKVDIAFIDITSLAKKKLESREVYLKSIQAISQEIAPNDKFSRLAFYLPENLPADVAQLVQTAFAFKVYDFFQPKNGQFRADVINNQLHRPKSIENGTKFFTLANQAVQSQSHQSPVNDNMFVNDSDDINNDEMMDELYKAVTGKSPEHKKSSVSKVAKDVPGFKVDEIPTSVEDKQSDKDSEGTDVQPTSQTQSGENEASISPEDNSDVNDGKQPPLHRIQPYEKQFTVEKKKRKHHWFKKKDEPDEYEEQPVEEQEPNEVPDLYDDSDDYLTNDFAEYDEPSETTSAKKEPLPQSVVSKKKKPKKSVQKVRKHKKKAKKKRSKLPLILLGGLAIIVLLGINFIKGNGLSNFTSSNSTETGSDFNRLLNEGNFVKAVEEYPSKQSQVDNYILNDEDITNKASAINQVYTNAESPNDTVVFDNAYFQKDWDTVIANKDGANLTMQRKAMLCIAYLGKGNVNQAQIYAKEVDNHDLNDKVSTYIKLQQTSQQIENKLKDNSLSQDDRQQLQKQLNNNKEAMKNLVNN